MSSELNKALIRINRVFAKAERDVNYYRNMYQTEMLVRMQKEMEIQELKAGIEHNMLSELNVKDMEIAQLHNLLTECGNELFQCDGDGLWVANAYVGSSMHYLCKSLNEIIHGIPYSKWRHHEKYLRNN